MKKLYVLLAGVITMSSSVFAQTFSDNFDSYTAGGYLASQSTDWTTWNTKPGTTEDVKVSNADAHSAPNSLYFSSTSSSGGPTDLIKLFGGTYKTGQFNLEFWMKVESGKAAYFNMQGASPLGNMFVFEANWFADGTFDISNQADGNLATGSYAQNTWFKFNMNVDLTLNEWVILIDGTEVGRFANSSNQLYAMDIFPVNQVAPNQAGYYIDDFSYTYTPYTSTAKDLAVTQFKIDGKIAGAKDAPTVKVRNIGTTAITSFDVAIDYDGQHIVKQVTGANITALKEYAVPFSDSIVLASAVKPLTATITNINGGADDVTANDSKTWNLTNITPATGKMVVAEEGTGTWCQWCPRGAVFMDKFSKVYAGAFVPVAVHNNDPMALVPYDQGLAFSGYPNAKVDRGTAKDPSAIESDILSHLTIAPKAVIKPGASWNATSRELKVSLTSTIVTDITNDYKIALVLTEDDVKGTASGYAQKNAYAGGASGPMGGYETLGNPVPAAQMAYNHVARMIEPSFTGEVNSFPATALAGEQHTLNYTFIVPDGWDVSKVNIIGILRAPDGTIDNAGSATFAKAIDNGFVTGTEIVVPNPVSTANLEQIDATVKIYPNPAQDFTNLVLNLKESNEVQLDIIDLTGKTLSSRNYGQLNGAQQITISTSNLSKGIYLVNIKVGAKLLSKRLIVE